MDKPVSVGPRALITYGLLGWAMGAIVVPIYIQVPYLYNRVYEVPSAWVGVILLLSRLIDAVLDPAIGLWVDRRNSNTNRYVFPIVLSVPFLLLGMAGVFFPVGSTPIHHAASLMVSLLVVHLGYSLVSIAYQSWGAELGNTDKERSTFVAVREGVGIFGVIFAVSLSLETHGTLIYGVFVTMLIAGLYLLLKYSLTPTDFGGTTKNHSTDTRQAHRVSPWLRFKQSLKDVLHPLSHSNFRRLMVIFLCNGLAGALPATLVPFYMRDRLGLTDADQWVLAVYFLIGAVSTVFWVWLSSRLGLAWTWLCSIVITVPTFALVATLGEGDFQPYLWVCIVTGFALGGDLSMPAALVARVIGENGERGSNEGTYFGLWNWMTKLNLALAPTVALGTLQWFSYSPEFAKTDAFKAMGLLDQLANDPLIWMYSLIPCGLKILAMVLLVFSGLGGRPQNVPTGTTVTRSAA
ncbi:MAG TPA: MFS transporter [Limnobacter sp.]|uniref:MFS transporter n=1 Tax=Limnobacter sp. TaxID=2003368 RepID=UPI002EDAE674